MGGTDKHRYDTLLIMVDYWTDDSCLGAFRHPKNACLGDFRHP